MAFKLYYYFKNNQSGMNLPGRTGPLFRVDYVQHGNSQPRKPGDQLSQNDEVQEELKPDKPFEKKKRTLMDWMGRPDIDPEEEEKKSKPKGRKPIK